MPSITGEKGRPRTPIKMRFLAKVNKSENGCWEWVGAKNGHGYGRFKDAKDVNRYAHRISWQLAFGAIQNGLVVAHKCDNPGCVNPEHLFLVTQKANLLDAQDKGRRARS